MKDRSKQFSKTTWKDPTRSLSRLARIESKLVGLFRNYRRHVLAEIKPAEHPFTQMEPLVHGGEGSGNFGHSGRPGEVGGSGPGGSITIGDHSTKTERLDISIKGIEGKRITFDASTNDTEISKDWLTKAAGSQKVVEGIIDVTGPKTVYLNRLDAKGGKGYGKEATSEILRKLSSEGYETAEGYTEIGNPRGQSSMRGLGATPYKETKDGIYWRLDLSKFNEPHTQKAPQWPASFSIEHFYQRLEDLTTQELIGPANAILEKEIPDAFTHGTKYADLNLKAKMGIKLGAPLEERQRQWQKVGVLVEKAKGEFKGVSDAVNQQIRRAVADGMVNEDSFSTVTKAIQDVTADVGENRARTIARTETMKAINTGVKERYKEIGVTRYERLEAEDEKTCEYCSSIDGKVFTQAEADEIDANMHPNCRGTWIISEDSLGLEEEATQKEIFEQITGGQGRFL